MKSVFLFLIVPFLYFSCNRNPVSGEKIKQEVWNTVKSINYHLTITGDIDSLGLYLHDDMIMAFQGAEDYLQGKNAVMEAYKSYVKHTETISFTGKNPVVQLYDGGEMAVVLYYFTLKVRSNGGKEQLFTGKDMYTLIKEDGKWYAVAQHYSFY